MTYSGIAADFAWQSRRWPPAAWLPSSLAQDTTIVWLSDGEEVGALHVCSLFMTQFINFSTSTVTDSTYSSTQSAVDVINAKKGFPILAHPWGSDPSGYLALQHVRGIEVYNAFGSAMREQGTDTTYTLTDRNSLLERLWDSYLTLGRFVVAFSVNDHYGPNQPDSYVSRRTKDSGKTVVLVTVANLQGVMTSVERGAIIAVRDNGLSKGTAPYIADLTLTDSSLTVVVTAKVEWVSQGRVVFVGNTLPLRLLPSDAVYVRARITGGDSTIQFLQPIRLHKVAVP